MSKKPKKIAPYKGERNKLPGETNAQARDRAIMESERRAMKDLTKKGRR
jgi:hypothetical protein